MPWGLKELDMSEQLNWTEGSSETIKSIKVSYSDILEAHWFDDFLDRLLVTLLPPVDREDMSNLVTSLQIRDTYRSQRWPISQIYNLFQEVRKKQYQGGKLSRWLKQTKFFFLVKWSRKFNDLLSYLKVMTYKELNILGIYTEDSEQVSIIHTLLLKSKILFFNC